MILRINKYSIIARKGPRRYYDLQAQDFLTDEQYFTQSGSGAEQIFRNYSLAPVYQAIQEGTKVEIYRSTRTVGEQAQISWLGDEKIWVIANKNTSVFAKTLKDLDKYKSAPKSLFSAVLKIAKFWFKFVKDNIKDKGGFVKSIQGKTL